MKKILLLSVILSICVFGGVKAQTNGSDYRTAVGIKGYFKGSSIGGLNIKHFMRGNTALEGSLMFGSHIVAVEGIYEWTGRIRGARGLDWYVGPGAMLGVYTDDIGGTYFALKGAVGLDYKFTGAPIDIALDVNPSLRFAPNTDFELYAGLAFRFAF